MQSSSIRSLSIMSASRSLCVFDRLRARLVDDYLESYLAVRDVDAVVLLRRGFEESLLRGNVDLYLLLVMYCYTDDFGIQLLS